MPQLLALEGNEAVAQAMRQIDPDVVAAYPITPQTEVVQKFSEFVHNGEVKTEYVPVESEHSALSACIGAAAAGARVMTATCANGLALMWEMVYIAASLRLPVVMSIANRALSGNINIHCDHSDSMGCRDAGWIQLYGEDAQEAYDNLIQAVRIAEASRLPVMNCYDGFFVSHAVEGVQLEDDEAVKRFVGEYTPAYSLLDLDHPITIGPLDLQDFYFEHKRTELEAYGPARQNIIEVGKQFGEAFGRSYGLVEPFMLEDADLALVALGSTAGTAKDIAAQLRRDGRKTGVLKIRAFRPFPGDEIAEALSRRKAVAVLDRSATFGAPFGPVYTEVTSALYRAGAQVPVAGYLYGLGGREVRPEHLVKVFDDLDEVASVGAPAETRFLGLRE